MLPKENRLKRMKDWEILFKEGGFVNGVLLSLKVWKIDPEKYPRRKYSTSDLLIGFAVGLKVSKSAVKRNRIKRQLREVVRLLLKEKKVRSGYLIGVIAKPGIVNKEYQEIEADVLQTFKKTRLLI